MRKGYAANAYPYTPSVGLLNGLEALDRDAAGRRARQRLCPPRPHRRGRTRGGFRLGHDALRRDARPLFRHRDARSARPRGSTRPTIVERASLEYGMAFGTGLGDVAGKVFRIGHLGMLTDAMALSGLATAEMVMVDLGLDSHARLRRRGGAGASTARDEDGRRRRPRDEGCQPTTFPTYEDMLAAHERIRPHIHRTPVLTSSLSQRADGRASCSSSARTSRRPAPSRCAAPPTRSSGSPRTGREGRGHAFSRATTRCRCPMRPGGAASPATWSCRARHRRPRRTRCAAMAASSPNASPPPPVARGGLCRGPRRRRGRISCIPTTIRA